MSSSYSWVKKDPRSAAEFAEQLPAGDAKETFVRHIAQYWSRRNPQETLDWSASMGESGHGAVERTVSEWASKDISAAAAYVTSMDTGHAQNKAISKVVDQWAHYDPKGAADWLMQFDDVSRAEGIKQLSDKWFRYDTDTAVNWIDRLPYGASRDVGAEAIIKKFYKDNPTFAFEWAQSIQGEKLRHAMMEEVAREWIKQDVQAASEMINISPLPDETIRKLLEGKN